MATETTLSEKTLEDIEKAAQILSAGGLVAVPTETVYGLAADADNPNGPCAAPLLPRGGLPIIR